MCEQGLKGEEGMEGGKDAHPMTCCQEEENVTPTYPRASIRRDTKMRMTVIREEESEEESGSLRSEDMGGVELTIEVVCKGGRRFNNQDLPRLSDLRCRE